MAYDWTAFVDGIDLAHNFCVKRLVKTKGETHECPAPLTMPGSGVVSELRLPARSAIPC